MKKILKITSYILIGLALFAILFLTYFTIIDYRPNDIELISKSNSEQTLDDSTFSIMTWNIGYAGLSDDMDFFYDGGSKVRPTEEVVKKNMEEIANYIRDNQTDFIILQEIDIDAKRSYYTNQVELVGKKLPSHKCYFAKNYDVSFVPLPIFEPMGKVLGGLASYCSAEANLAERHRFPFNFKWPLSVFMLDRCFLEKRYKLSNGKELLVINTHNSAFDDGGEIRKAELNFFKSYLISEYGKGNYIIVGGDFNQSPPNLTTKFDGQPFDFKDFVAIPDTFLPKDWNYVYDNRIPSNRRVVSEYRKGETLVTLIDFFITSPNIVTDTIYCQDLQFKNSDHNPVFGRFKLKK